MAKGTKNAAETAQSNVFGKYSKTDPCEGHLEQWQKDHGSFKSTFASKLIGKKEEKFGKNQEKYAVVMDDDQKLHIVRLGQFWLLDEKDPGSVMLQTNDGYEINPDLTFVRDKDGNLSII